ncbi:hypothetical protein D3C86_1277930 [compost metagenome]
MSHQGSGRFEVAQEEAVDQQRGGRFGALEAHIAADRERRRADQIGRQAERADEIAIGARQHFRGDRNRIAGLVLLADDGLDPFDQSGLHVRPIGQRTDPAGQGLRQAPAEAGDHDGIVLNGPPPLIHDQDGQRRLPPGLRTLRPSVAEDSRQSLDGLRQVHGAEHDLVVERVPGLALSPRSQGRPRSNWAMEPRSPFVQSSGRT